MATEQLPEPTRSTNVVEEVGTEFKGDGSDVDDVRLGEGDVSGKKIAVTGRVEGSIGSPSPSLTYSSGTCLGGYEDSGHSWAARCAGLDGWVGRFMEV